MFEGFKELNTKVKFVSFIENAENPYEREIADSRWDIFEKEELTILEILDDICFVIRNTMFTVMYIKDNEVMELKVDEDSDDVFEYLVTVLSTSYDIVKGKRLYVIDSHDMFFDEGPFVFLAEDERDFDLFITYIFDKLGFGDVKMKRINVQDAGSESTFRGVDISHLRLFEYYDPECHETCRFQMRVAGYYDVE